MRIDGVIFAVESKQFGVLEDDTVEVAGELPPNVEPFSDEFYSCLDRVFEKVYPNRRNNQARTLDSYL